MLLPVTNMLRFYISTFRSMCAVPSMAVFGSSLTSCFPIMLFRGLLNYLKMLPFPPVVTGTFWAKLDNAIVTWNSIMSTDINKLKYNQKFATLSYKRLFPTSTTATLIHYITLNSIPHVTRGNAFLRCCFFTNVYLGIHFCLSPPNIHKF
jgi:hypothetical protein